MKRENLIPTIGILSLVLCIAISIQNGREKNLSRTSPALPLIMSETQPMSVEELYARFRRVLADESPNDCSLEVDKNEHAFIMTRYDSYFSKSAVNAALSDRKYLKKWNDALSQLADLGADMQDQITNHGHPEYSVIIRVLNCDDFGQLFALIDRGVVTYDIVADMPPGEKLK